MTNASASCNGLQCSKSCCLGHPERAESLRKSRLPFRQNSESARRRSPRENWANCKECILLALYPEGHSKRTLSIRSHPSSKPNEEYPGEDSDDDVNSIRPSLRSQYSVPGKLSPRHQWTNCPECILKALFPALQQAPPPPQPPPRSPHRSQEQPKDSIPSHNCRNPPRPRARRRAKSVDSIRRPSAAAAFREMAHAPGPDHKTAADYMSGVFTLELRKDLLSTQHATHPDIAASQARTQHQANTDQANNNTTTTTTTSPTSNGELCSEKSPLPSDSAYFTTSESKAKLLTRLRGSSNILEAAQPFQDHHQLNKRKEELVKSIGRKLEILRAEQEAIKEEQRLNQELGAEVTTLVEKRASHSQSDKYKLHVEEIHKITSLLLGLSGRLARAENAHRTLGTDTDPEEKRILESKRDKLSEQLEEAKRLKENIDRRAVQVSKVLNQYLTEDEYADYDHFIKMKAKLIMDAREIDDKIKLGEEQQLALKEMIVSCKKP